MTEPFHYTPLKEVIAGYEKDPEKKRLLDIERAKTTSWMQDFIDVQPIELDMVEFIRALPVTVKPLRYQLANDIDESQEQEDGSN